MPGLSIQDAHPIAPPQPLPIGPQGGRISAPRTEGPWRGFWDGLIQDLEILSLLALLTGLCLWFAAAQPTERLPVFVPAALKAALLEGPDAPLAEPPFAFVSASARTHLHNTGVWSAMTRPQAGTPRAQPLPPPAITAAIERHAIMPESGADPLGLLMVHGLPDGTAFSAGAHFSNSTRAVAVADLDGLVITLPPRGTEPIRTTLDIVSRSGVVLQSFGVEVRESPANEVSGRPPPRKKKRKALPAQSTRIKAKSIEKAGVSPPPKPSQKTQQKPGPAAVSQAPPAPQPAAATTALLPLGFFNPDPKDSISGGLNPDLRDDPRFMTLRGLGMQPLAPPGPQGPAP